MHRGVGSRVRSAKRSRERCEDVFGNFCHLTKVTRPRKGERLPLSIPPPSVPSGTSLYTREALGGLSLRQKSLIFATSLVRGRLENGAFRHYSTTIDIIRQPSSEGGIGVRCFPGGFFLQNPLTIAPKADTIMAIWVYVRRKGRVALFPPSREPPVGARRQEQSGKDHLGAPRLKEE